LRCFALARHLTRKPIGFAVASTRFLVATIVREEATTAAVRCG
jgi:hypothetical protein